MPLNPPPAPGDAPGGDVAPPPPDQPMPSAALPVGPGEADGPTAGGERHLHEPPHTPLWRNTNFTLMWTSAAASGFGDRMMMLAALALLGAMGGDAESTSINAATQFFFMLPYFLFGLPAGWLADHLPRKWILLGCDEARAAILFLAYAMVPAVLTSEGIPLEHHWKVFGILFLVGTFAAIFNPSRTAIVPQLVATRQLQAGNALLISISVVASMVGVLVADLIIDPNQAGTVKKGLIVAMLVYGISGTFFAFLRLRPEPVKSKAIRKDRSLKQAAIYSLRHKRIITLTALHVFVWGAAFLVYTAPLAIGKVNFGLQDAPLQSFYAWMTATVGAGMLGGAAVVAWIGTRREATIPMMVGLILAGISITVVVMSPWQWLALLCSFLTGVFGNVTIITIITLLQSITPNFMRGRVMGLDAMNTTVMSLVVTFLVWRMRDAADHNILFVLDLVGPAMALVGLVIFVRYLRRGTMPNTSANVLWKLQRFYCLVWHTLRWHGRHHLPATGGTLLAANHTTALDPFLMQACSPRLVRWLMLSSYRSKLGAPLWNAIDPICLDHQPGDEKAGPGTKQVRQIVRELKAGSLVGVFPEGHLQYDDRVLEPFQDGVAVMARLSGAPVVPCWIAGTPRSRNMLMHFLRLSRCEVVMGPPLHYRDGETPAAFTQRLRDAMQRLCFELAELHRRCPGCHRKLKKRAAATDTARPGVCDRCGCVFAPAGLDQPA